MKASTFVGRVGGLAIALGAGAVISAGVASADGATTEPSGAGRPERGSQSAAGAAAHPGAAFGSVRGPARTRPVTRGPANRPEIGTDESGTAVPQRISSRPAQSRAATVTPTSAPVPIPRPAAAAEDGNPTVPVSATSAIVSDSITVNPTVAWNHGVLSGTLDASTTSGARLSYVVVSGPSGGGKIGGGPLLPLTNFGPGGSFTYIPYATALTDPTRNETFRIMVLENAPAVQFVEDLLGPLGNLLVPQVLAVVHRIPIVGDLLSPIIGQSTIVTFDVNPYTLAADRPTAFTYRMPSFDGTLISVNYFPALNLSDGLVESAPTVLAASGLACAANTDPNTVFGQLFPSQQFGSLTPGIKPLREDSFTSPLIGGPSYDGGGGYNVVTWDPRGEFASEGQLQIDNPFFEGRDVSAIITWLGSSANPAADQIKTGIDGDPLIGMTGGSYGGGIQLTTVDPRIDAILPEIGWNSLLSSLYPNGNQFKTGFGGILAAALFFTGARVNPEIYQGILTGVLLGWLSETSQAVLGSVGPTSLLTRQQAATLQFQGQYDTLFPLSESVATGRTITGNPWNTPYKLFWFCGGHGTCDIPNPPVEQDARGLIQNLMWLDQYVALDPSRPADDIPTFQWYDQKGLYHFSDLLPWNPGFHQETPYTTSGPGGVLGLGPVIGGSGPAPIGDLPFSITNAGKAWNALNLGVTPAPDNQIVGAPTLSFSYRGLGTSRTVYAQLVDTATGLVLGNNVTPIPVVLDGRERTVTIPMEDIAYSVGADDSLTLQITSSAVNYENFTTAGLIDVSRIEISLPLRAIP